MNNINILNDGLHDSFTVFYIKSKKKVSNIITRQKLHLLAILMLIRRLLIWEKVLPILFDDID
jgi:hypothetical protein